MNDPTAELMSVWLGASPDRKTAILKFARGEMTDGGARPVTGPLFLNMTKAAEFVGISRTGLWRLVKSGRLQRVELHRGCFRLRRSDLEGLAK